MTEDDKLDKMMITLMEIKVNFAEISTHQIHQDEKIKTLQTEVDTLQAFHNKTMGAKALLYFIVAGISSLITALLVKHL